MGIRFFDMFAGIGGFRSALEQIKGFKCVGHCEIDPYPNRVYNSIYTRRYVGRRHTADRARIR